MSRFFFYQIPAALHTIKTSCNYGPFTMIVGSGDCNKPCRMVCLVGLSMTTRPGYGVAKSWRAWRCAFTSRAAMNVLISALHIWFKKKKSSATNNEQRVPCANPMVSK